MLFGLKMNTSDLAPTGDTVIIDVVYDGYTQEDPQSARPMIFITNYPDDPAGIWIGTFQAPNGQKRYSAVGIHTVEFKVAPREAPSAGTTSADQVLPPREFGDEKGGRRGVFTFEIYPETDPIEGAPERGND